MRRLDPRQRQHVENQVVQPIRLLHDPLDKRDAGLAVVECPVAERFRVRLDRAQRRLELVRNVGHEVASQRFEPPQLGRFVHHDHDARTRIARQRRRLNRHAHLIAAFLRRFQPLRLPRGECRADGFFERVIADHFQEPPPFDQRRPKVEQPPGRGVRKQHPLAPIDRDHAFDHAAEHGGLPLVAGGELRQPGVEFLAHPIELAGQLSQFVVIRHVEPMAKVAPRDRVDRPVDVGHRPDNPADHPVREPQRRQKDHRRRAPHQSLLCRRERVDRRRAASRPVRRQPVWPSTSARAAK